MARRRRVRVDLCDALIAIGACDEAIVWVRAQGLPHASEVLEKMRRSRSDRVLLWLLWLESQLGVGDEPVDVVRAALVSHVRKIQPTPYYYRHCGCPWCIREGARRRTIAALDRAGE